MANVLILEDDPGIRHVATEMLRAAGFGVFPTGSVPEALTLVTSGLSVDAVVMDLMLHGASSAPFLRTIRKITRYQSTPVVLATGAEPARGLFPPADLYQVLLRKPYRMSALVDTILALTGRMETKTSGRAHEPA